MKFPDPANYVEAETASFIATLKEVFQGERWNEIRHYAEKAWNQCGLADGKPWSSVEDRVRAQWTDDK
jgi:hypothetical protein